MSKKKKIKWNRKLKRIKHDKFFKLLAQRGKRKALVRWNVLIQNKALSRQFGTKILVYVYVKEEGTLCEGSYESKAGCKISVSQFAVRQL